MTAELTTAFLLPLGLGLFAFVEPCAIGATLLFIKLMEGKEAGAKLAQVFMFTASRAVFTGLLGAGAAVVGRPFLEFQRAGWVFAGAVYLAIGVLYLTGRAGPLMRRIGPRLEKLGTVRTSAALGVFFGLSLPACAGPLLLALLASTASGATGGSIAKGFLTLAIFGLALSLPLVVAVLFKSARGFLDRIAKLSDRMPRWTGILMVTLGLWSAYFGFFVRIE